MLAPLLNNFSLATMRLICSSFQFAFWHIGFCLALIHSLLCSIAAIQEIRAAVFRFFQETTSYAGTQMVAAAFDAGKGHQDKMLLETPGSRSVSILWVLSQHKSWKRLLFVRLTVRTREGVGNTRSVGWNTSFWHMTGRRMKWPHSAPKDCPSLVNTLRKIANVCKYGIQ